MVLGIDLGTTYSAAAYMDENGEVQVITNSEGSRLTPSVFFEDTENSIVIGEIAKENAYMRPEDVVRAIKNDMGKKITKKTSSGKEYTPEEISSYIIRKMVQDSEKYIGVDKITDVVITVPAYFTDAQRKATEDAAKIAGVNMIGSVNEPTAAILSYIHKKDLKGGKYMVYDFGGGTFDVSIVSLDEEIPKVIGLDGVRETGGHFFDEAIVKYVCDKLAEEHDIDLNDEQYRDELQDLYNKAEKCKIQLSSRKSASIMLKVADVKETIEITREQFEEMIRRLYRKTETKVKNAVREAGITMDELDAVLMVGGSSRIPYIEEKVAALTGKTPARDINPDEAVASGAAIYGYMNQTKPGTPVVVDACSHSIGFMYTKPDGTRENIKLIKKNTNLPATYVQDVMIVEDNQARIDLMITEGEGVLEGQVDIVETVKIKLPEGLRRNDPYTITYSLDKYQMLHIDVKIPTTPPWNYKHKFDRKSNLSEGEVIKLTGIALANTVS